MQAEALSACISQACRTFRRHSLVLALAVPVGIMAEFHLLGPHIPCVLFTHRNGKRYTLAYRNAVFGKRVELVRVVAHQAHRHDVPSRRIAAAESYSRESPGRPRSRFASTVSRPCSCSAYARILLVRPIPRPS